MIDSSAVGDHGVGRRIIDATSFLVTQGGRSAASTRAVCSAAEVTPPTIYRLFDDKQGLLDAVVADALSSHLQRHDVAPSADPVQDLRQGWDQHITFAIEHPRIYSLMYGDRVAVAPSPAATNAWTLLAALIHRIARAGRLAVAEAVATQLVHAAGTGTALTLISMNPDDRNHPLSELAREAVITAITNDTPPPTPPRPVTAAIALRAVTALTDALTEAEACLLDEWLDRVIDAPSRTR